MAGPATGGTTTAPVLSPTLDTNPGTGGMSTMIDSTKIAPEGYISDIEQMPTAEFSLGSGSQMPGAMQTPGGMQAVPFGSLVPAGSGTTWADATDQQILNKLRHGNIEGTGPMNFGHYNSQDIADYRTLHGSSLMGGNPPSLNRGAPEGGGMPGAIQMPVVGGQVSGSVQRRGATPAVALKPGERFTWDDSGKYTGIETANPMVRNLNTQPNQGGKGGGQVSQPITGPAVTYPENQSQPTPYAGRPATQNINTQSAQGVTSAMQGAQAEMGYRPEQVRVPGTSATIGGVAPSTRIGNPGQSATIGGVGPSAQVTAGQLSNTNFDPYMNPYTDAVIKSTEGDILRGGQKQLTGLGSQASSAGAFGGSRHGIAMGEVGRNITEQMAKSSAGLRQANFQQAQQAAQQDITGRMQAGLANQQASQFDINNIRQQQLANQQASQFDIGNRLKAGQLNQQASQFDIGNVRQAQLANQTAGMQDIQNIMNAQQLNQMAGLQGSQNRLGAAQQLGGLANLGFGMGQTVQSNLANQGIQQQAMMQALIDASKNQYQGYTGQPAQGLGYVTQALGATGTPQSTTSSSSPGLFDYLTTGASIYAASDKRLKKNITKMGTLKSGLNIYKWDWKDGAKELGADMNHTIGVIAQEVKELFPNAVVKMDNGYYAVNYSALR